MLLGNVVKHMGNINIWAKTLVNNDITVHVLLKKPYEKAVKTNLASLIHCK